MAIVMLHSIFLYYFCEFCFKPFLNVALVEGIHLQDLVFDASCDVEQCFFSTMLVNFVSSFFL